MVGYIIKRLFYMVPTLFGMSLVSFMIIQLPPGDYLTSLVALTLVCFGLSYLIFMRQEIRSV